MMNIFKLSPFVENQFKQTPELDKLISGDFDLTTDWQHFKQKHKRLDIFALLRKYRQTRLALIATRDLQNKLPKDHLQTLKQTSQLAKLLITHAYNFATEEFKVKYGTVLNQELQPQSLLIFALGKLGGNELNYSSDVDLVFCYSGNGESDGKKCLDTMSYFQRLGRRIIQLLDSVTKDGIVYRVDMRLRPFGSAAPLVCSVNNLQDYLETEGRDWERYAWLRASVVAGDKTLGNSTLTAIEPFIYRKYLDYNIFESLRQIKDQIIRQQADDLDNIKLGLGGIREIEFIVQTLQLTFAGRNQELRGNDLWLQLHNLQAFGHISVKEMQQLTAAWLFLRKLENLCQIIHDKDVHHLPEDSKGIAKSMESKDTNHLNQQLLNHRDNVHFIFKALFISNQSSNHVTTSHPQIQKIKDEVAKRNFPKLNKHKIYAALDAIVPYLDKKIDNKQIIDRYQQVIDAVSKRISYLSMLIESPVVLQKLWQQIKHSPYFSNAIAKTPSLLEILFENIDANDFDITLQWQLMTKKHKLDDEEHYLEILCQFKQRMQFKAIMAYVDDLNNAKRTCEILSLLAQHILALVVNSAWHNTNNKSQCKIKPDDLIVIAYGSLAMKNMHLDSDFDLVFILDKNITDDNHSFIMRWIKRIIHLLSIRTYSGSLYQLDTQLRPNGKSGAAVVTKTNFENYQLNQAWIWEHAALIKSRAVYATAKQNQWFKSFRQSIINQNRKPKVVDKALQEMALKLQQSGKKNHHKEFETLGTILKQAHSNPKITYQLLTQTLNYKTKLNQSITTIS